MLCYIKDFKTFNTLAKYDATSWSLPEGTKGEVVIYQKNPIELTTKYVGMWLIINKELFYISEATPNDDNISLEIKPPIYAFNRQVYYNGQTTYGALISYILTNNYGPNCSDTEYRMSYMGVSNTDATSCIIETDDYGYIIPCDIFDDALYDGVAIDFNYTNTTLNVSIHTANYETGVVVFNDGKTVLEAESYDPNFIAKATVLHRLEVENEGDPEYEVIDFYLSDDYQISTTPPQNRAKGVWKYYTAEIDETPLNVAIGAFSHNNDNHKIEFYSPVRFNLYQSINMRLRGEVFNTIITSRVLSSEDDRYYYTCGNLATTLTEKMDADTEIINKEIVNIEKRIPNAGGSIFPVGSIYLSVNNTNPGTIFGGTWEQIKDKFLLSAGDTYTAGNTGGKASYAAADMPKHSHTRGTMNIVGEWSINDDSSNAGLDAPNTGSGAITAKNGTGSGSDPDGTTWNVTKGFKFNAANNWTGSTSEVGTNANATILPPYLVVYVWKRVS